MADTDTTTDSGTDADATDKTDDTTSDTDTGTDATSDADLGEAGKKAIKAERDARKAAEKERDDLRDEASRLRRSNAASKGTDLEAIKTEMRAEFSAQLVETSLRAEAKGRLADPADVLLYLRPADFADADDAKLTAAVDKLLTDKPYLAAAGDGTQRWGDVGGGQRASEKPEPKTATERMARAYAKPKN